MINQLGLKGLVVFSILMENGQGIRAKSPDHIYEKYNYLMDCKDEYNMVAILDNDNKAKYDQYVKTWLK